MRRRRSSALGIVLISFGIGLFLACCLPSSFLLAAVAVAIIIMGFVICNN